MKKVRCYDAKYLKGDKKRAGYNCQNYDPERNICLVKTIGGGKLATVFPSKSRRCEHYKEKEEGKQAPK